MLTHKGWSKNALNLLSLSQPHITPNPRIRRHPGGRDPARLYRLSALEVGEQVREAGFCFCFSISLLRIKMKQALLTVARLRPC